MLTPKLLPAVTSTLKKLHEQGSGNIDDSREHTESRATLDDCLRKQA